MTSSEHERRSWDTDTPGCGHRLSGLRRRCDPEHTGRLPAPGRIQLAPALHRRAAGDQRWSPRRPPASAQSPGLPNATGLVVPAPEGRGRPGAADARVPRRRLVAAGHGRATCGARAYRTYRSDIRANVGCTLSAAGPARGRLEEIARRRGSRVADRRPQPGRDAGPRRRRTPPRPGLGDRHHGQPDAGAGRPTTPSLTRSWRPAGAAEPGRACPALMAEDCVAGRLRPRRASTRAAGRCCPRTSTSPRSTPAATASSTGGRASTRWRARSRSAPRTSGWRWTRGVIAHVVRRALRRVASRSPVSSSKSMAE